MLEIRLKTRLLVAAIVMPVAATAIAPADAKARHGRYDNAETVTRVTHNRHARDGYRTLLSHRKGYRRGHDFRRWHQTRRPQRHQRWHRYRNHRRLPRIILYF